MFHKLRLKLTLTNVAVVSVIFLILTSGIFFVMERNVYNQVDQLINTISSSEGLSATDAGNSRRSHNERQYRYFSVKLNKKGEIISSSKSPDMSVGQLNALTAKAMSSAQSRGHIESEDESYQFLKNTLQGGLETSILFIDTRPEHEMLENLLAVLFGAGLAGLALAFFGSLFMADRSLIPITLSWKRQRDFVADASHELRAPLTVIQTTLDLLINREEQTIGSQMKWIENIQTENKRMTKLVNDLLFLARADSEQIMLEMKSFPLHTALLEAYIPFEALALQHGIRLEPFEGPEIEFWGDEAKIKQLVVILVDNAIKYTPSGGLVKLFLKNMGTWVEITVSDTGEGIDREHVGKIFQRFYRVDKSRSRKEGSLGLGLSIAEWIVKEHHGSIKVESEKSKGSTFCITLPNTKHP